MAGNRKDANALDPSADAAGDLAVRLARAEGALTRIKDFQFGSDERPGPATRAVAELQQIARDGLGL